MAVASAAPTKSNQKGAIKRSYYETPVIYEDVIEEEILEVKKINSSQQKRLHFSLKIYPYTTLF